MGQIIKTVDDSGRPIVLKTILEEHQADQRFRELFLREAEITCQLDHPHIVKAYKFESVGNQLVMALEFLDGVNVKEILKVLYGRKLVMPAIIASAIMTRVLRGLDYAHKKRDWKGLPLGIVHRDLNPSNIFVTYAGEVKILDFGISKAIHKDIHNMTPQGELRGKMCYIAPEQIRGDDADYRADIFTSAIVLWELLAGRPLYLRESDAEVLDAIRAGEYTPLTDIRSDLPAELDAVIRKALSVKPQNRYRNCEEFAVAVESAIERSYMPGTAEEEISVFARALFNKKAPESEPEFLAGYAWLMTQMQGRKDEGLELVTRLATENPQRPYVLLNYARAHLAVGDRAVGLRVMRKLARADAMESEAQRILEWLGVRRKPVFTFLKRSHPANFMVGKIRHHLMGPTKYQQEFLAA